MWRARAWTWAKSNKPDAKDLEQTDTEKQLQRFLRCSEDHLWRTHVPGSSDLRIAWPALVIISWTIWPVSSSRDARHVKNVAMVLWVYCQRRSEASSLVVHYVRGRGPPHEQKGLAQMSGYRGGLLPWQHCPKHLSKRNRYGVPLDFLQSCRIA